MHRSENQLVSILVMSPSIRTSTHQEWVHLCFLLAHWLPIVEYVLLDCAAGRFGCTWDVDVDVVVDAFGREVDPFGELAVPSILDHLALLQRVFVVVEMNRCLLFAWGRILRHT